MRLSRPVPYISEELAQSCYRQVMQDAAFRNELKRHLKTTDPVLHAYLDTIAQKASAAAQRSGLVVYHTIDRVISVPRIEMEIASRVSQELEQTRDNTYWLNLYRKIGFQNQHFAEIIGKMIVQDLARSTCPAPLSVYRLIEEQLRSGPAVTRH